MIPFGIPLQDSAGLPVLERVPGGERGAVGAGLGGLLHVLPGLPRLRQHLRRLPHARIAGNVGECFITCFIISLQTNGISTINSHVLFEICCSLKGTANAASYQSMSWN